MLGLGLQSGVGLGLWLGLILGLVLRAMGNVRVWVGVKDRFRVMV